MDILGFFEERSKLRKKIIILASALILIFTILEIWMVNHLATYGSEISKLETTKQSLITENMILKNNLNQKSSLLNTEEAARKLGFDNVKKIVFISSESAILENR